MTCQCGNTQDEPQINPPGRPLYNIASKKWEPQMYRAGHFSDGRCWFCATSNVGIHLLPSGS